MRELPRLNACANCSTPCTLCRTQFREEALRQAPGRPVVLLHPAAVKVRSIQGRAVAYTVTDVLVEWTEDSFYHLRWEASWLVRRSPG